MDKLKRILYLFEYDNKTNKEEILEGVNNLLESRQTEQQSVAILRRGGIDNRSSEIINRLKSGDNTNNKILLPILSYFLTLEGENKINNIIELGVLISKLLSLGKIKTPLLKKTGVEINNRVFSTYNNINNYIHDLYNIENDYNKSSAENNIEINTNDDPIYDNNNIQIYYGDTVGKCINYTMGKLTGKKYSFCIGQPGNKMWQSYRDIKGSTFYYIVDKNRDSEDPLHLVVLDRISNGKIELTDTNNTTGNIDTFGRNTEGYLTYLRNKGVDVENIFKNMPMTDSEVEESKALIKNSDLEWFKKLSYDYKSKYIGRGNLLSDYQFMYLWKYHQYPSGFQLLKQYLDTGLAIPLHQFDILISDID